MQGHQHEWQNLLLGFQSGPTNHQSWFGNYQITENVPHFNFTVTVFIVSWDSELRWMSLIPFISEPTPKSVCITLFFERHWLVQILLHYRCVVKVLIASGLKSERCWNSDIVWKFLTEQDDPQKTFAAFFWTDDWGQVKSFFGYVCLSSHTYSVPVRSYKMTEEKIWFLPDPTGLCATRIYCEKKLQSLWLGGARRCDASVRADER